MDIIIDRRCERGAPLKSVAAVKRHLSFTTYCKCRGEDGCCDPHTTLGVTQTAYDDRAEIDDATRKEIVDGEKDAVVVADGQDENAGSSNLDDECEYINDNLTVVGHDSVKVV